MPTYSVYSPEGQLSAQQKSELAKAITRIHHEVTGAPGFFAQVIFHAVKAGDYFMGGAPMVHEQVFIHGHIRGGRGGIEKRDLMTKLAGAVSEIAAMPRTGVWIYIAELTPRQMIEFGHILPEAGDEPGWTAGLPEADRAFMRSIGK